MITFLAGLFLGILLGGLVGVFVYPLIIGNKQ